MQLSQKQNYFCEFFSQRFKSSLNFEQFFKKDDRISDVFLKLWTPKNKLDQCLISRVSEDTSKSNMINWHKHC